MSNFERALSKNCKQQTQPKETFQVNKKKHLNQNHNPTNHLHEKGKKGLGVSV